MPSCFALLLFHLLRASFADGIRSTIHVNELCDSSNYSAALGDGNALGSRLYAEPTREYLHLHQEALSNKRSSHQSVNVIFVNAPSPFPAIAAECFRPASVLSFLALVIFKRLR